VSDFSTWAGAASFFRNVQPQVFYANQLFNIMIRAVQWAVYGDIDSPFPAPQVSNANLAAIVRLDADGSNNLDAQIKTINYLVDLARESGVVPVYAWVSSGATKAGWQDLAPLGKKIEEVGGEIGTHSKYHRINKEMTAERWEEELSGSIHEIEFNLADYDYPLGEVEWFINPGNTIQMKDYEQIAKRFSFYMTHGFEQDMPLGYGNLTWYTGPHRNLVVLENIPSPDYQWFNDPTWSYTTAQITAYEEAIFDHLYERSGRGVIFNEMWHDYSITTQPQSKKDRIINESNIAFYDAMKAKFASRKIYCPTPEELGHKLRAMAQWNYRWRAEAGQMEVELDLSNVLLDTIPHFTGGMGLRIENTKDCIQKVTINGKPHFAFTDQMIILPNLKKGVNKIYLTLGAHSPSEPRLTYVSSRMPEIEKKGDVLEVEVLTKSKARFSFYAPAGAVVLNADWQEWNRAGDGMVDGYVTSDRQLTLRPIERQGFRITRAEVRLAGIEEKVSTVTLKLHPAPSSQGSISFRCAKKPARVVLANQALEISQAGRDFRVAVPEHATTLDLMIEF
jgi:peptidoglycan/xylan/chitin deacetylase (PgdA/CDA1 family)